MSYYHQAYDDLGPNEVEVIEDNDFRPDLVHWSKADARGKAIIEAKLAFGVEPDGVLCWYVCFDCEPNGEYGWSLQFSTPRHSDCPQCGASIKPNVYDMWCVEES